MKKRFALLAVAATLLVACKPSYNGALDVQRLNAIPKVIFGKALIPQKLATLTTPAHYALQSAATAWVPAPIGTVISCRNSSGQVVGTTTVQDSSGTYTLSVTVGKLVSTGLQKSVAFVDVVVKDSTGKTVTVASAPVVVKRTQTTPTPVPADAVDQDQVTIDATSTVVSSKVSAAASEGRDASVLANENRPTERTALLSDTAFQAVVEAITSIGNLNPDKLGTILQTIENSAQASTATSGDAILAALQNAITGAAQQAIDEVNNSTTLTTEEKQALQGEISGLNSSLTKVVDFVNETNKEVNDTPKPSDSFGN